jgi:aminopeptidase N
MLQACKSQERSTKTNLKSKPDEVFISTVPPPNDDLFSSSNTEEEEVPIWAAKKGSYNPEKTKYFQLINTALHIKPDWEKQYLYGKATLTLSPHFYPQDSIVIDAKGFDIQAVTLNSKKQTDSKNIHLRYRYDSLKLTVFLDKTYTRKDTFLITIDYTAKPNELVVKGSTAITADKGLYFINPTGKDKNKPQQIWTQGETEASSCWYPTFDQPNMKSAQEIYITIDTAFTTISNGKLISQTKHNDGTRTDYWKQELPHAPYLFAFAIGKYAKITDTWNGKEVSYYVEPEYAKYGRAIFGRTPEMMSFFSKKLNYPFPWDKYAQIVVRDFVSGAMENTSCAIFMERLQVDDRYLLDENWDDIIAHELFHHWFGDLVTCESWANLPLNESFATYAEYLWREYKNGKNDAELHRLEEWESYFKESSNKQEPLIRYYYLDKEEMFDNHSYAKGSLILHMLRSYVGDEAFFEALNLYLRTNEYKTAEINDLRIAFEKTTGEDLNWFFNQWFLSAGHPKLYLKDEYENGKVVFKIRQLQNEKYTPIYRLPVDIDIWTGGKATRHRIVVENTDKEQSFTFEVSEKPALVQFDPQQQLIGEIDYLRSTEAFIFQYQHAENILARLDALRELKSGLNEPSIFALFEAALSDTNAAIREEAVSVFEKYNGKDAEKIMKKISEMALTDKNATVRAFAIRALPDTKEFLPVVEKAIGDSSYTVAAFAVYHYAAKGGANPVEKFERFEKYNHINLLYALADYYTYSNTPNKFEWFEAKINQNNGYPKKIIIDYLGQYLLNQPLTEKKKGIAILEQIALTHDNTDIREKSYNALLLLDQTEGVTEILENIRKTEKNPTLKAKYEKL